VHVLYAYTSDWAEKADAVILQRSKWTFERVGGSPNSEKTAYFLSRLTRKINSILGRQDPSFCRSLNRYISIIKHRKPDLVIGHNPGSLPILSRIHQDLSIPVLFDAEDFHRGEFKEGDPNQEKVICLENTHIPRLQRITAASPLIGAAYEKLYPHLTVTVVNNAFDRALQRTFHKPNTRKFKFIWFSQVIGLDRGIQGFMKVLGQFKDCPIELTLIGQLSDFVEKVLRAKAKQFDCPIEFLAPMKEEELFKKIAQHHFGLAIEKADTQNRQICRTNKLFVYPLAGVITLATRTLAQDQFFEEYPNAGISYPDENTLLRQLTHWANHPEELEERRRKAWELARDILNWEHESKILLQTINTLLAETP
jgi:glycosyltransferase involved in cell wall biosynthesis